MKLDEGLNFQKLSLDLTPLIDIIFLLVLFFAVSTSFISREDLTALKENITGLSGDKASLSEDLQQASAEITALQAELARADRETASLAQEKNRALGELDAVSSRLADVDREREQRGERIQVLQQRLDETSDTLASARQRTQALETSIEEQRRQAEEARSRLDTELSEARSEVQRLEGELAEFREVAALDRELVARILEAQQALQSNLDEVVQDDQLNIERKDELIVLQLSDRILFDSGSAAIKPEGAEVLAEVGNTIKSKLQRLSIQVAGHTDNVPITSGQWPDNWSLSAARAVNVLRLLESRVGIDPELLSAVGYGEHRPIADNDSAAGRAKNRRIELVLVPR